MARTARMNEHFGIRTSGEEFRSAGSVVEMNVGNDEVAHVFGAHPRLSERREQPRDAMRGIIIDKGDLPRAVPRSPGTRTLDQRVSRRELGKEVGTINRSDVAVAHLPFGSTADGLG